MVYIAVTGLALTAALVGAWGVVGLCAIALLCSALWHEERP